MCSHAGSIASLHLELALTGGGTVVAAAISGDLLTQQTLAIQLYWSTPLSEATLQSLPAWRR